MNFPPMTLAAGVAAYWMGASFPPLRCACLAVTCWAFDQATKGNRHD